MRSLGADHVIDYTQGDSLNGAKAHDLTLDIVGGEDGGRWTGATGRQIRAMATRGNHRRPGGQCRTDTRRRMTSHEGKPVSTQTDQYAARLNIDYPERLDRVTTAFRLIWIIPIAIVATVLSSTATSTTTVITDTGEVISKVSRDAGGIVGGLFAATLLMILFRQRYPRWWFDFALQLQRFFARIGAYAALLTDTYPSTEDEQSVHLELDYPDAKEDLNRWLPLVKWLLAIPHIVVLTFLGIGALFAVIIAWFAILFTGRYPRGLFDYVVGVGRWALRVTAYATLLVTDKYPPFRLS